MTPAQLCQRFLPIGEDSAASFDEHERSRDEPFDQRPQDQVPALLIPDHQSAHEYLEVRHVDLGLVIHHRTDTGRYFSFRGTAPRPSAETREPRRWTGSTGPDLLSGSTNSIFPLSVHPNVWPVVADSTCGCQGESAAGSSKRMFPSFASVGLGSQPFDLLFLAGDVSQALLEAGDLAEPLHPPGLPEALAGVGLDLQPISVSNHNQ